MLPLGTFDKTVYMIIKKISPQTPYRNWSNINYTKTPVLNINSSHVTKSVNVDTNDYNLICGWPGADTGFWVGWGAKDFIAKFNLAPQPNLWRPTPNWQLGSAGGSGGALCWDGALRWGRGEIGRPFASKIYIPYWICIHWSKVYSSSLKSGCIMTKIHQQCETWGTKRLGQAQSWS